MVYSFTAFLNSLFTDDSMTVLSGVQAVIYDLDGTIIDTEQFHRRAWELASREYGLGFSGEEIYHASKGISSKKTLERILPPELPERGRIISDAAEAKFRYMMGLMEQGDVELLPGFMETFDALQQYNLPLGICTSARQENVEALQRNRNSPISRILESLAGKVAWKEMFSNGKPSAEPLQVTLQMMGNLPPERAVYVGDAHPDYLCAHNAGTQFVYFCENLLQKVKEMPETVPTINDHRGLLALIRA
jgi:pyrophosphatase PpaX